MEQSGTAKVYTVDEVAAILGIGVSTVHDHIRKGQFPHIRVGRFIRVSQKQLNAYLGEEIADEEPMPAASLKAASVPRIVLQIWYSDSTSNVEVNLTEEDASERIAKLVRDRKVQGFAVLKG